MNHKTPAIVLALVLATCGSALAADAPLDLSAWQRIPVFRGGRIMPLDTFARTATDVICDRQNPTLSLAGIPSDQLTKKEFAGAKELFPDGKPRKFTAPELLLSWLTEPDRWEHVPFLIAEHDDLRTLLGVPVTAPDGTHLKYVSPALLAKNKKFEAHLKEMGAKSSAEYSNLDNKAKELFDAFTFYRQLTFNPKSHEGLRIRFIKTAEDTLKDWKKLDKDLSAFEQDPQINEAVVRIDAAIQSMATAVGSGHFELAEVEPSVITVKDGIKSLSTQCDKMQASLRDQKADAESAIATQKQSINRIAPSLRLLVREAEELHVALYDNTVDEHHDALRVVPAINPAALNKDRDVDDASQPWLTLQTVLYGSMQLLKDYPQSQIFDVRSKFARLAAAYSARSSSQRPAAIKSAAEDFAATLRLLGDKTTKLRDGLQFAGKDEALLKYTAYPAPDSTANEVEYNRIDPFKGSWMLSLSALFAFALSFGVIRKPMFWLGMLLLGTGLAWTAYGFYLRMTITHWAPVTNMYETVVYVPFFVSMLGAWFTMLPITWPGFKRAWQLSGVPGTWEANSDGNEDLPKHQFGLGSLLVVVARVAIMVFVFQLLALKPYAAGGRTIINLQPVVDVGAKLPDLNNFVVWIVGMCVLLPTVWFLPRALVTFFLSFITVPSSLHRQGWQLVEQVYVRKPFGLAATFAAFISAFLAWYSPVLDKNFTPLQPVLRDNFWLTIHVLTIVSSYGAGMLAWGLGNLSLAYYLFGKYRDREVLVPTKPLAAGFRPAEREDAEERDVEPSRLPPAACKTLAGFIYKAIQVAVLLLAAGTILGGLWADVSWGRFWGWDPKEVWALISLLTYLVFFHGRYAGWVGDFGLAAGSVMGATVIVMSWYGVNFVLGVGLHSYGFGAGGQWEVGTVVVANWLFAIAAGIRYGFEMMVNTSSPSLADEDVPTLEVEDKKSTVAQR